MLVELAARLRCLSCHGRRGESHSFVRRRPVAVRSGSSPAKTGGRLCVALFHIGAAWLGKLLIPCLLPEPMALLVIVHRRLRDFCRARAAVRCLLDWQPSSAV